MKWVLHARIPVAGHVSQYQELMKKYSEIMFAPSFDISRKNSVLESWESEIKNISKKPSDFVPNITEEELSFNALRICTSSYLTPHLRNRATINQSAVEAYDYGDKIMKLLKEKGEISQESLSVSREINYLRNASIWLKSWGKRGFGYLVI